MTRAAALLALLLLLASASRADEAAALLRRHCIRCHAGASASAGLRLDRPPSPEAAKKAAAAVRYEGAVKMPPTGKLAAREIAALAQWAGAARARVHWAFQPIRLVLPPPVEGAPTGIDAFVRAKLLEQGLDFSSPADRRTLLRRLTFDLTGLPPTPVEVNAFLADARPDAYERVVERLLASPAYGERWGRHWLDIVHYADTHGYDKDKRRDNAWPYRDWVIDAFNQDLPYRRFVAQQVAGDVLFPGDPDGVVATGFLVAGPWDFVGQTELAEGTVEKEKTRTLDRDDLVSNAIGTFNSVTVHCARCHDHKFDPIPQRDYYRLQAVFAGIERGDRVFAEGETAQAGGSPSNGYHSAIESRPDAQKWVQVDLGRAWPLERLRLIPARPTDFADTPGFGFPVRFRVEGSDEPTFAHPTAIEDRTGADVPGPGAAACELRLDGASFRYLRVTATRLWKRTSDYVFALAELQAFSGGRNVARGAAVSALDSIEAGRWSGRFLVDGFDSRGAFGRSVYAALPRAPRPIRLLARGEVEAPRERCGPGALSCLSGLSSSFAVPEEDEGARRVALAQWLTDPKNPLTWRSVVNRVWQRHFGRGLVETPNDFGRNGAPPSHPELLDYLAATFRDGGQSLKALHRQIVRSRTYRQSARVSPAAARRDADNRWLSRAARRRLDAEEVRDSVLAVSGALDRTRGGPGFALFRFQDDHSPVYDHTDPARQQDPATFRRTVYRFTVRSVPHPLLEALDCADPNVSMPVRNTTLTALQSLALLNDPFLLDQAERFAARLRRVASDPARQIDTAFALAFARLPQPAERAAAGAYLRRHGLENLCRLLFNANEFVFVD